MDTFLAWTKDWFDAAYEKLSDNSFMFIFWSQKYLAEGIKLFNPDRVLLWHYSNLVLGGNGDFAYDYEPILVVKKGNPKLVPGKHSCIFDYTKPQSNFKNDKKIHLCQKPIELIKDLIQKANPTNVLDCFAGSGTTNAACNELGIDSIGIEKDTKYYNDCISRLKGE